MAADENALGALHSRVAEVLTEQLDGQELPTGEFDDAGNEIKQKLPPSAATITAAIQFLKNNNITCTPADDNKLGELEAKMRARRERRGASKADLASASETMGFMSGMPLN